MLLLRRTGGAAAAAAMTPPPGCPRRLLALGGGGATPAVAAAASGRHRGAAVLVQCVSLGRSMGTAAAVTRRSPVVAVDDAALRGSAATDGRRQRGRAITTTIVAAAARRRAANIDNNDAAMPYGSLDECAAALAAFARLNNASLTIEAARDMLVRANNGPGIPRKHACAADQARWLLTDGGTFSTAFFDRMSSSGKAASFRDDVLPLVGRPAVAVHRVVPGELRPAGGGDPVDHKIHAIHVAVEAAAAASGGGGGGGGGVVILDPSFWRTPSELETHTDRAAWKKYKKHTQLLVCDASGGSLVQAPLLYLFLEEMLGFESLPRKPRNPSRR